MKQLLVFIRKEFYHVFRDRRTLLILFGLPLVQILLFGYALTSEVKNVDLVVINTSGDLLAQQLTARLQASALFNVQEKQLSPTEIENEFKKGHIKAALIFPSGFSNDLIKIQRAGFQVLTDGSEPNISKTITRYLSTIVQDFRQEHSTAALAPFTIVPELRMLYNEEGNGSINFVPGVLALILMIVCTALTSVAVVREKETGTMEILLVSPFRPAMVLVAKAVPFLLLSLANFSVILLLAVYVLNVPLAGSLLLLFVITLLFIATSLSFGLLISNATSSQQVALLISMMGLMLPTIIFTGFIFPLENMPLPFQWISNLVPAKWYYSAVKSVMLKGLGLAYVWKEMSVLCLMTILLLTITVKRFQIRLT
ncbi:ABC transporter permease [Niabella drilacis]|uniref:ABC-2 type transport system permease protein n=1 Tax=Niabella drilacis (strain DSM 25811 / CCM 8410 / CCUG 62505 / LMG 26954 / E90) TaxID=1285928 RepID=A0A1G6LB46_NIADE|nr:ABC transporter permease [Niabella drilacis]SDC39826.1 ABC-2 type transport system permease protein [Niabella drilacis]